jgi:hypothetical protein
MKCGKKRLEQKLELEKLQAEIRTQKGKGLKALKESKKTRYQPNTAALKGIVG